MSTKLSEPLATYFAGHKNHDVDAMIGPFAEGAHGGGQGGDPVHGRSSHQRQDDLYPLSR